MHAWRSILYATVVVMFLLAAGRAQAAVSLGLGQGAGAPGDSVELALTLDHTQPLSAAQADIHFDPTRFSAAQLLPSPPQGVLVDSRLLAPGHLRIVLYSLACSGSGAGQAQVASLRLTI
ncbi:MAG: cohesin domain-containing protein, partial [Xanthomonadales bacterium]|nr:cohesin domain-containing protein [Xanthomonadales bacterium]